MFIVGLTGGIGSGKTTAANFFQQLGITIIDADIIAREVIAPPTGAYKIVIDYFGPSILNPDLSINRKKLGHIVFLHPEKRLWLEELLHPLILQQMKTLAFSAPSPYCIMVIPLLIESSSQDMVNRILTIDVSEEAQIARIILRDNTTTAFAKKILLSQTSRQKRILAADDVIHNEGSLSDLHHKINLLHNLYLSLAKIDKK